jgi:hypothetical protein
VAELAGIQPNVVGRASEILAKLTSAPHVKLDAVSQPNPAPTPLQAAARRYRKQPQQIPEGASLFDFAPYTSEN